MADEPYCPWADLGQRFPDLHAEVSDIWPARAGVDLDAGIILIDKRLNRAQGRSALAHEIAHLDLRHQKWHVPRVDLRQERDADALAARRLVDVRSLADAYIWTNDDASIAEILNVDISTLHARFAILHPSEEALIEARMARVEHVA
ncbi:MAG: ImmA/IrrE family metallo-endopeptidase [bacterium]|nr:ImmA/IrrE family metallo-endopeptidase [bacterium]